MDFVVAMGDDVVARYVDLPVHFFGKIKPKRRIKHARSAHPIRRKPKIN